MFLTHSTEQSTALFNAVLDQTAVLSTGEIEKMVRINWVREGGREERREGEGKDGAEN